MAEGNKDILRFFRLLIGFRKTHLLFRQHEFIGQATQEIPRIIWHGVQLHEPDWSWHSKSIAVELQFDGQDTDLFFIFNAFSDQLTFLLPTPSRGKRWHRLFDTYLESPGDIAEPGNEPALEPQTCTLPLRAAWSDSFSDKSLALKNAANREGLARGVE